jgi:hypothetical protein
MKTSQAKDKQETAISLDQSFNEWVPRHELAKLVPYIVKTAGPGADVNMTATQAEMMLAILVYCYAIGIYRSREIEQRLCHIQARGQTTSGARSDAAAFTQFRRWHAPLVKVCLASALFQAFRMKWNKGGPHEKMTPRLQMFDCRQATDSDPVILLESEAERRLALAETWDRFDQEGWVGNAERRI